MPAADRFVGREAERALLRAELEGALQGEGRLVVLAGEPGIGKTRTAKAVAAEARERGAAAVWGRCHAREGAPAYWPFVQALAGHAAEAPGAAAAAVAGALELLCAGGADPPADGPPERARFQLFDRVVRALAAAARERPLLIVVDDLHWADEGSLLLLEFLARELGTLPLLVLATVRDLEPQADAKRAALLAGVVRLGTGVRLAGLPRPAVEQIRAERRRPQVAPFASVPQLHAAESFGPAAGGRLGVVVRESSKPRRPAAEDRRLRRPQARGRRLRPAWRGSPPERNDVRHLRSLLRDDVREPSAG